MRKFLFIGIFTLLSAPAMAASFPDVPADHPNYEAVEYLDENQIINGYNDGTFKPDELVNRAEALKIIVGALELSHDGDYDVLFPDVTKDQWFFSYVMAAQNQGIVRGYDDGKFKPEASVNLAETLKMLTMAADTELPEVTADVFVDVPPGEWFAPYLLYARNQNIVLSDDYGAAKPAQAMTRAAFAEVVYRMTIVRENNGEPFPLHLNWPEYRDTILPFKMKYDSQKWEVISHNDEVVFWKPDNEFLQFSPARIYANTGVVRVTLDENVVVLSKSQYFSNLKRAFPDAQHKEFSIEGLSALEVLYPVQRIVDWYIYLENGQVLAVYTQYGPGVLGYQLRQVIGAMLETLAYYEPRLVDDNSSAILNQIFENVLVEGSGVRMLNLLPDKTIVETDAIGVGTGPVDYYYSQGVNYTFKYERSADVILDTREGQTTAF